MDDERYVEVTGHLPGGQAMPQDARRTGLDRYTGGGALLALAGGLRPARRSHRLVAWLLLAAFTLPLLFGAYHRIF